MPFENGAKWQARDQPGIWISEALFSAEKAKELGIQSRSGSKMLRDSKSIQADLESINAKISLNGWIVSIPSQEQLKAFVTGGGTSSVQEYVLDHRTGKFFMMAPETRVKESTKLLGTPREGQLAIPSQNFEGARFRLAVVPK